MKSWLINIGLKKFGPSALRGGILAVTGFLAAHSGVLSPLGISFDQATNILSINFTSLETWITTIGLTAVGAGLIKVFNHHGQEMLPKKETPPQA